MIQIIRLELKGQEPSYHNCFFFLSAILFLCIGTGGFDCGSNALINIMLGPKVSRPYTQSLHTCVALGFAAGMIILY